MAERAAQEPVYEVECPHCGKPFRAELLNGATERHQGFKCPHCKLFVPLHRAEEQELAERVEEPARDSAVVAPQTPRS